MGDMINGVTSEYEMPREPKFYSDDRKLSNIPIYKICASS